MPPPTRPTDDLTWSGTQTEPSADLRGTGLVFSRGTQAFPINWLFGAYEDWRAYFNWYLWPRTGFSDRYSYSTTATKIYNIGIVGGGWILATVDTGGGPTAPVIFNDPAGGNVYFDCTVAGAKTRFDLSAFLMSANTWASGDFSLTVSLSYKSASGAGGNAPLGLHLITGGVQSLLAHVDTPTTAGAYSTVSFTYTPPGTYDPSTDAYFLGWGLAAGLPNDTDFRIRSVTVSVAKTRLL